MGLWACENRTRRAVQQAPLSRLLLIATILLLAGKAAPQHASKPNRRCGEIFDQAVDEETLRNLFKSSVMSAMSYLEYEKDSAVHPWSVDFESTSPKTRLGSLRISIRMYICQARSLVSRMFNSILKSLYSLPLLRYLLRRRETKGAINLNDAEKSVDGKNSQSQLSKTDSCQVEENAWESFKFRWFFADWREGLWHDTEVLLGESATTAVIIFRGSDTAADLFTNSQTMEPALHSYYFGSQAGTVQYFSSAVKETFSSL